MWQVNAYYVIYKEVLTPYLTTHACRLHARLYAWMHGRVSSRGMFHLYALPGLIHKLPDERR